MNLKKLLYISIGCLGLGLGAIAAVVPLLPAFPFLLTAALCFGKSSERLNNWFIGTKLYKNNLESYIQGQGMTVAAKVRLCTVVSLTMLIGFIMMRRIPIGQIILAIVWVSHLVYFTWGVKTIRKEDQKQVLEGRISNE